MAVGLGARLPVFGQRNTARIASGIGGTVNLTFSVVFVSLVGVLFGWISLRAFHRGAEGHLDAATVAALGGIVCMSIGIAAVALWVGVRHLRVREF